MTLTDEIGQGFERVAQEINANKRKLKVIEASNRYTQNTDERWITNANNSYGPTLEAATQSCGVGAAPAYSWATIGHVINEGETVERVDIFARMSAVLAGVTGLQVSLDVQLPIGTRTWQDGISNSTSHSEFINLFRGSFYSSGIYTMPDLPTNAFKKQVWLPNYTAPKDAKLVFSIKTLGAYTGTLYTYANYEVSIKR